jgi:hypothetical protein
MLIKQSAIPFLILLSLVSTLEPAESYLAPAALANGRVSFWQAHSLKQHSVSIISLQLTSNELNEDDFADALSPVSENASNSDLRSADRKSAGIQMEFAMQVGTVAVLAFVGYTVITTAISGVMGVASSASHALTDEVMREFARLGSNIWGLFVSLVMALWEVLKVVVPFVGKGIVDTGKAIAPVVGDAASSLSEAATPYMQEASRVVGEAASPYVQEAARVVDESLVAPVKLAVDANIVAPVQGAQTAVTSQLNAVQTSVTSQIDSTLNDVGQTVSSTIQGATDQATAAVKGAVDAQTAKIVAPVQEITGKVDASVKGAVKPLQDFLLF